MKPFLITMLASPELPLAGVLFYGVLTGIFMCGFIALNNYIKRKNNEKKEKKRNDKIER